MPKQVKTTKDGLRVLSVKEFYERSHRSLLKTQNISPEVRAQASQESLDAALARAREVTEDRASIIQTDIRLREFNKTLGEDFTKEMETQLVDQNASRADSVEVLKNFSDFNLQPTSNDAFLANAAAEAQLLGIDGDANRFRGEVRRSAGALKRSVGMFPKEEKLASLVIKTFGDANTERDLITIDQFFLTQVSEPSSEKYQIYQTFDQDYIFFFDRNPHIYVYSGVLINAADNFQWRNEFQEQYERSLRGTRCIQNNARAVLTFEDVQRQGYLLEMNMQNTSNNPMHTPFSFTFFVVQETNLHDSSKVDGDRYDELVFEKRG
jgi:hypothetical protein